MDYCGRKRRRTLVVAALAAKLTFWGYPAGAFATSWYYFGPAAGSWTTPSNWNTSVNGTGTSGVPGMGTDEFVYVNEPAASHVVTYNVGSGILNTLGPVTVESYGGYTNSIYMPSGNFYTSGQLTVGLFGVAVFNQTGGTVGVINGNALDMGFQSNANGTYLLGTPGGSGSLTVNANEAIGWSGYAVFNQYSGSHVMNNTAATMYIAFNGSSSVGTYNLSGGNFNISGGDTSGISQYVGYAGSGKFNLTNGSSYLGQGLVIGANSGSNGVFSQTNGSQTIQGNLTLGNNSGSTGTYQLSGGSVVTGAGNGSVSSAVIGNSGVGTFVQTGGTYSVGTSQTYAQLFLGNGTSGGGTYTLSNTSGPSILIVYGDEFIGNGAGAFGAGTVTTFGAVFNQTGGTNTLSGGIYIAAQGTGCYQLSGGVLQTSETVVAGYEGQGGIGYFNQSGGVHSTGTLSISPPGGGRGVYNLVGGALNVSGSVIVGYVQNGSYAPAFLNISGTGVFNSTTAPEVSSDPSAAIDLSGGTLNVPNLILDGGPSDLQWTGGVLHFTTSILELGSTGVLGSSLTLSTGMTLIPDAGLNIDPGAILSVAGGSINLSAGTTIVNRGTINQSAGTLVVNGAIVNSGTVNLNANVNWQAASVFVNLAGTANIGAPVSTSGFGPVVVVTGGSLTVPAAQTLTSLSIGTGAVAQLIISGRDHALVADILNINGSTNNWTGKLDLGQNDLIVPGGSLGQITNQIFQGFNGGHWNGLGIISTAAAADPAHLTALGVIQNNQGGSPLFTAANPFDGNTPGASDILVKFTYCGDTNLDGKVDGSDYSRIDNGYLSHATGWFNGDFNYDGVINGSDYTLIDNSYNAQGAQLAAAMIETDAVAAAQVASVSESVPEPTAVGMLSLAVVGLLCRRRRDDCR